MEITRNLLKQRFAEYNQAYFEGKLTMPKFSLPQSYHTEKVYTVNRTWKYRTEDFFKDVLVHEMIHQYVYEMLKGGAYHVVQHGLRFHYVRWKLYRKYGLKISPN